MRPPQWARGLAATVALVTTLGLSVASAAFGADPATPPQPSTIERLVRQEDAKKKELARYDEVARRNNRSTALDARDRIALPARSGDEGFAWGAAALGLGVGVAGMLLLLGGIALVRHDGRLRSA